MSIDVTTRPMKAAAEQRTARPSSNLVVYTRHYLRSLNRAGLIWGCVMAVYLMMLVWIFPSIKGKVDVSAYPEAMRTAFNITSIDTLRGYLQAELFSLLPIVLAFYPMTVLSGVLAGAEERRTLDVLLGNPLPRWTLVVGSFLALAAQLLVLLVIQAGVLWVGARTIDAPLSVTVCLEAMLSLWPFCLAFGALALALSATVHSRTLALGPATGIIIGMYLINIISQLASGMSWLKWVSAIHYFGTPATKGIYWTGAVVLLIAAGVLVAAAAAAFERRDIYT